MRLEDDDDRDPGGKGGGEIMGTSDASHMLSLLLTGKHVFDVLGGEGLWTLERHTKGTIPDELGEDTEGAGDTKEDGVKVLLDETIVLKEDTRVGIDVGPGVLGLTVLEEDVRDNGVELGDELEEGIGGEVLEGKLTLAGVTGIGLTEDGVTVTGDDLTGLEGGPDVLTDLIIGDLIGVTEGLTHLHNPTEDLLVGETMKGTGETIEASGEGEVGIGEGGTDEVSGMSGDVTTFVIRVDGEVETEELDELGVREAEGGGEVLAVIGGGVDEGGGRASEVTTVEDITVDTGGNGDELGNQVHRVLIGVLPVLGLGDTPLVGLGKGRVMLEGIDGQGELGHGVKGGGARVNEVLNKGGDLGAGGPLLRDGLCLLGGGDLTGQKEPEEGLREGFLAIGGGGKELLALGDGLATEADSLDGVKDRAFPDHALDTTHASVGHVNGDLTKGLITVSLLDLLDLGLLLGDNGGQTLLETLGGGLGGIGHTRDLLGRPLGL